MSVFDELLGIKRFRESQSEMAMVRKRQLHLIAEHEHQVAEQDLEKFRIEAEQTEKNLYTDLCARIVRLREIENVLQQVADMRTEERQHEDEVQIAQKKVETALEAVAIAREAHQIATRITQKFVELAQLHLEEHLKVVEQKEELEMEEVAAIGLGRDREEWQQADQGDQAS